MLIGRFFALETGNGIFASFEIDGRSVLIRYGNFKTVQIQSGIADFVGLFRGFGNDIDLFDVFDGRRGTVAALDLVLVGFLIFVEGFLHIFVIIFSRLDEIFQRKDTFDLFDAVGDAKRLSDGGRRLRRRLLLRGSVREDILIEFFDALQGVRLGLRQALVRLIVTLADILQDRLIVLRGHIALRVVVIILVDELVDRRVQVEFIHLRRSARERNVRGDLRHITLFVFTNHTAVVTSGGRDQHRGENEDNQNRE